MFFKKIFNYIYSIIFSNSFINILALRFFQFTHADRRVNIDIEAVVKRDSRPFPGQLSLFLLEGSLNPKEKEYSCEPCSPDAAGCYRADPKTLPDREYRKTVFHIRKTFLWSREDLGRLLRIQDIKNVRSVKLYDENMNEIKVKRIRFYTKRYQTYVFFA